MFWFCFTSSAQHRFCNPQLRRHTHTTVKKVIQLTDTDKGKDAHALDYYSMHNFCVCVHYSWRPRIKGTKRSEKRKKKKTNKEEIRKRKQSKPNETRKKNFARKKKKKGGFINSGYSGSNILFATHKYKTSFIVCMRVETIQYINGCQHTLGLGIQYNTHGISSKSQPTTHRMKWTHIQ